MSTSPPAYFDGTSPAHIISAEKSQLWLLPAATSVTGAGHA